MALLYFTGKLNFRSNKVFSEPEEDEDYTDLPENSVASYTNQAFIGSQEDLQAVRACVLANKSNSLEKLAFSSFIYTTLPLVVWYTVCFQLSVRQTINLLYLKTLKNYHLAVYFTTIRRLISRSVMFKRSLSPNHASVLPNI